MTEKKISFGFSKLKKPALLPGASATKKPDVQMIQCLEGQTIKIIGQQVEDNKPLVIPLIGNTKTSAALAALKTIKNTIDGTEDEPPVATTSAGNESGPSAAPKTLEQKAAQEILSSLQEAQALAGDSAMSSLVLPLTSDELPLDGALEPTQDDYDAIPIGHFGLAMLRGMGWKDDEQKAGKTDGKLDGPVLRPKGMGLGADKMVKAKPLLVQPAKGELLEIRKGACVRILSGKRKDLYGTIESMDDHAGRILVKMTLGGAKEWLNEFMMQPVPKEEYAKYAKVINSAKYEEYKIMQDKKLQMQSIKMEQDNVPMSRGDSSVRSVKREESSRIEIVDSESDERDDDRHRASSRRSRSTDRRAAIAKPSGSGESREKSRPDKHKSSSRHRRHSDDDDKDKDKDQDKRDDRRAAKSTAAHSDTQDSDDDSDGRRRHHRKSAKHKSSGAHKKKKSKSRRKSRSESSDEGNSSSDTDDRRHKKKTKKSKRGRSRSRSRQRR